MGFHRNLPRCIVFAPREVGGIGLCNLRHEMELQQIMILLRHLRAKTQLGQALEILIRTYQLWAGTADPILEDTRPCPWIPDCWLSRLHCTLHQHHISITHDTWTYPPIRDKDVHIMDALSDLNYSTAQLRQLNACRMHLKLTTLAEMTDHTGMFLLPQVTNPSASLPPKGLENISTSLLDWPASHSPTIKCWRFWTRTIQTVFTGLIKGTRLQHPLGPWKENHCNLRFWQWRYAPSGSLLHQKNPTQQPRAAIQVQATRRYLAFSATIPTNQQFNGDPVTPTDTHQRRVNLPIPSYVHPKQQEDTPQSYRSLIHQFRQTLQHWQSPLFGPLQKLRPTNTIANLCATHQNVAIVSDASVRKHNHSGFAWVIANDAVALWRGVGLAPGTSDDMYSGRAEAFGLLAALTFLQHYITSYGPDRFSDSTINCYCDNLGIITTLTEMADTVVTHPNDTTNDDRDVYLEIMATARRCQPLVISYFHVLGHQDKKANHPLTITEQLNVECDKNAKRYVLSTTIRSTNYGNPALPAAQPHLRIDGKIICRKFYPTLRNTISTPDYNKYLRDKFQWTHHDIHHIHWQVIRSSIDFFPPNDQ